MKATNSGEGLTGLLTSGNSCQLSLFQGLFILQVQLESLGISWICGLSVLDGIVVLLGQCALLQSVLDARVSAGLQNSVLHEQKIIMWHSYAQNRLEWPKCVCLRK